MEVKASDQPLSGLWTPLHLQHLFYGPDCVKKHLLSVLPSDNSRAYIVTGKSLATKTTLIKQVEDLLAQKHAGTVSNIGEHAPIEETEKAIEAFKKDSSIDTIISIGGGSPIDATKLITYRIHEQTGKWLYHIAIPTTLSAAECSGGSGYTTPEGEKKAINSPKLPPRAILYDSKFGLETPPFLFLSTGLRALDHALELLYHPYATEICKANCLQAAAALFENLPKYKANPKDEEAITRLFLAAFASLAFLGDNKQGGLGLSHAFGYALGSPYHIPHGVTSCLTLGRVVQLKAEMCKVAAGQLARVAPFIGLTKSGDATKDAKAVGEKVQELVKELGLETSLTERKVGRDQVGIILERATGMKETGEGGDRGPYEAMKKLVESLY